MYVIDLNIFCTKLSLLRTLGYISRRIFLIFLQIADKQFHAICTRIRFTLYHTYIGKVYQPIIFKSPKPQFIYSIVITFAILVQIKRLTI